MKTSSVSALCTLILFAACSGTAGARLPAATAQLPAPVSLSHIDKRVPVPAALQGRWAADFGIVAEECEPEFPDGFKWSIDARTDRFHYWESRGTPTKVRQLSANRFVVDLDVEGEGHEWKKRSIFTLSSGGRVLTVDDPIPEMNLPYRRYRRCPAR